MIFLVTVGCLVLHQRYKRRIENYLSLTKDLSTESIDTDETTANDADRNTFIRTENGDDQGASRSRLRSMATSQDTVTVSDIEDLCKPNENDKNIRSNEYCNKSFACSGTSRQQCHEIVRDYHQQQKLEFKEFYHGTQSFRHTVMLILLLCSMFVSISLKVWTLIMDGMSGIYIELSFLEAFLNFGQCMLVSVCFITDTEEFWKVVTRYWRKVVGINRNDSTIDPTITSTTSTPSSPRIMSTANDTKIRIICDEFIRHHLNNCKAAIGSERFAHCSVYKDSFYGTTFVNWLITVGLASDRRSAITFANYLVDGGILHHINDVKNFYDRDIIYRFSQ